MIKDQPLKNPTQQLSGVQIGFLDDGIQWQQAADDHVRLYTEKQWNSGLPHHGVPKSSLVSNRPTFKPGRKAPVSDIYELSKNRERQATRVSSTQPSRATQIPSAQQKHTFDAIPENQRDRMFNDFARAVTSCDTSLLETCITRWQAAADFYSSGVHPLHKLAGSRANDPSVKEFIELARRKSEEKYLDSEQS